MGLDLTYVLYMSKEDSMAKKNKTVDRIQAVWNKLGGEEGIDRLLRGELVIREAILATVRSCIELSCDGLDVGSVILDNGEVDAGLQALLVHAHSERPAQPIRVKIQKIKAETTLLEVLREVREQRPFEATMLAWAIAALISKQRTPEKHGHLDTDQVNYFVTRNLVIGVYGGARRDWKVFVCEDIGEAYLLDRAQRIFSLAI